MDSSDRETRLAKFRASLRLQGARYAFDLLMEYAPGKPDQRFGPAADEFQSQVQYVDAASGQSAFCLCSSDGELMFDVHEAGFALVPGGLPALEAGLGPVTEMQSSVWRLRIANPVQAEALSRLLFVREQYGAQISRHWRLNLPPAERVEIEGSYLWAPKKLAGGSRSRPREGITSIISGDIVFAYSDDKIGAIGVVLDRARSSPDPKLSRGDGWLVPVRFEVLNEPLSCKEHLPKSKHRRSISLGDAYLADVSNPEAQALRRLLNGQVEQLEERVAMETDGKLVEQAIEEHIWQRTNIGPLDKRQLSFARRGRGVFRENVERIESACRVTGILDRRYLLAVHIKPWKDSSDSEKLDGANGLLLSPHIIHLFNRGHVSFADDGSLLISRHLNPYVLKAWGLEKPVPSHVFRAEQRVFLEYHRKQLFERLGGGRRAPGETA